MSIDWGSKVEKVFTTQSYGRDSSETNEEEESRYIPEEDYEGWLALMHPYIFCRLICMPMADNIEMSSFAYFYGGFSAVAKNPKGVTYGDVMHALAKE